MFNLCHAYHSEDRKLSAMPGPPGSSDCESSDASRELLPWTSSVHENLSCNMLGMLGMGTFRPKWGSHFNWFSAFRAKTFGQRSLCFSRPLRVWSPKQQSMDSLNSAVYSKQSEAVICPSHPPRPSRSSWAFQKKRWWKSAKWNTELHAVLCTDV